ncbi:hypothetical protein [Roseospira visakhapatnamensis]|uniref:Uncharacterized protein n=1 Tax=Roseospira visakhapatnamensis TaxID=390880 RepID=A0A7W6RES3_9PROT|nr:hypothetical protein [Roseospira visakhapatnamensis]MBB4267206.1 hypothetical protein [Roseospira visakhapatnamensis]
MIAALYESGRVADLLIALVALEALGLVWLHRRTGRPGLPWGILLNLLTGVALVAALGAALRGLDWPWIATGLLVALAGHLGDLVVRWRATAPHQTPHQTSSGRPS